MQRQQENNERLGEQQQDNQSRRSALLSLLAQNSTVTRSSGAGIHPQQQQQSGPSTTAATAAANSIRIQQQFQLLSQQQQRQQSQLLTATPAHGIVNPTGAATAPSTITNIMNATSEAEYLRAYQLLAIQDRQRRLQEQAEAVQMANAAQNEQQHKAAALFLQRQIQQLQQQQHSTTSTTTTTTTTPAMNTESGSGLHRRSASSGVATANAGGGSLSDPVFGRIAELLSTTSSSPRTGGRTSCSEAGQKSQATTATSSALSQQQQRQHQQQQLIQRILAASEVRETTTLQLQQLEQLQAHQHHRGLMLTSQQMLGGSQQQQQSAAQAATNSRDHQSGIGSSAALARFLSGMDGGVGTTIEQQQQAALSRALMAVNTINAPGSVTNDSVSRLPSSSQKRGGAGAGVGDHNNSANNASSLFADAISRHHQDLRLHPSSLFQYRDAATPGIASGGGGVGGRIIGMSNQGSGAGGGVSNSFLGGVVDPSSLPSSLPPVSVGGGCVVDFIKRRRMDSISEEGKRHEVSLISPQKKRRILELSHDVPMEREESAAAAATSQATTMTNSDTSTAIKAKFPLPGLQRRKEFTIDPTSRTNFELYRKWWKTAGERSKSPTMQKELFLRKVGLRRHY